VIVGAALGALLAVFIARLSEAGALEYAAYPTLAPPPVAGWALVAALALLGPVVATEMGWT
jgi:hypothetical protein